MIIEEISENNFKEKVEELEGKAELKLKKFDRQIEDIKNTPKRQPKPPINWYHFLDPSIFSYKILKDESGEPLKLRGFQDLIINDKSEIVVVTAANQIGKTITAVVKALHHAIFVPRASVLIVSRSEQQATFILDQIRWMMRGAGIKFEPVIGEVENRTELHITNHDKKGVSVIRCLPPTQRVYAYPATLIICDEIGFWKIDNMKQTEFFNKVIRSRVLETKERIMSYKGIDINNFFKLGQIFCISSTNAQQGILWHLWNIKEHNQYRFCWLAKKGRTLEKYNRIKNTMSSDEFDSVFAAVFSSATGGFITGEEYNDAVREYIPIPSLTVPLYFGGDFAGEDTVSRGIDESVLFGAIKIREDKIDKVKIEYYKQFPPRTKKTNIYAELERFNNIGQFSYDKMGVGDSVKFDLIDRNILAEYQIESLTYSLPNKSDVYYNMKHLFEQRKIILPAGLDKLKEQLLGLKFERTQGGHMTSPQIKVHHKEGLHDDWADALANCCWATMRGSAVPVELTIVETKAEKKEKKGTLIFCSKCKDYHFGDCDV